jgi:hypothetical protein
MCRCESDECCNLRAEYIDSRIGRLVSEQADPPTESETYDVLLQLQ